MVKILDYNSLNRMKHTIGIDIFYYLLYNNIMVTCRN